MARILIMDGFPRVRELFREELAAEGHRVETTDRPDMLEKLVQISGPDLILLDLYVNGSDRWDILGDLKKSFPFLPVLIFTAYDGYRRDPRSTLADGYVIKSICLDELKRKIAEVLDVRGRGSPPLGALPPREGGAGLTSWADESFSGPQDVQFP